MVDRETRRHGTTQRPLRVRLPGFIDEEIGLGDVLKRVTHLAIRQPCSGCEQRAAALNRWMVLTGKKQSH
jgi:hypothetical protein